MHRETVNIYKLYNYHGNRVYYTLEKPGENDLLGAEIEEYYLPRGWTKIMNNDQCLAIKARNGELVKFFMAKSISSPGICLSDGSLYFLDRVKQ